MGECPHLFSSLALDRDEKPASCPGSFTSGRCLPVATGQQAVWVQERGDGVEAPEERKYVPCEMHVGNRNCLVVYSAVLSTD